MPNDTPKPLLDSKAAAARLAISTRTLWSLQSRNAVPHYRIGRAVRFDPLELQLWLDAGAPTEPDAAKRIKKAVRR